MTTTYCLRIKCPDSVGIVAAVSGFLADNHGWITEAKHHSDASTGMFYMRQEVRGDSLPFSLAELRRRFQPIAERFAMEWSIRSSDERQRVVLLVSKQDHCLADLLHRWRGGEYAIDIPCIISNHEDCRQLADWYGVPYEYVPIHRADKDAAFDRIESLYREAGGEVMVLARFMQILPPALCERYFGQIINIHHSFLPSFMGAKPYHQAFDRGVKLIGATCHYVTSDLDAGPIIEQEVVRVNHSHGAAEMVRLGKDVETITLARGLAYHLQDRVVIHENKTVVLT